MLIRDAMEPIQSMADGRFYDSRSAYYRSVKQAGCEIVGNDTAPLFREPEYVEAPGVEQAISDAIDQLEARL